MEIGLIVIIIICSLILSILVGVIAFYILEKYFSERVSKFINKIFKRKKNNFKQEQILAFVTDFSSVLARLSNDKIGALMVIENRDSLKKYIDLGNKIDSVFFSEFVFTVFYNHKSALHDGAMIIKDWRIVTLSTYLPVSKRLLDVKYGARHRAAFGISEVTDALAFVVSETTGKISHMYLDKAIQLSNEPIKLAEQILSIFEDVGIFALDDSNKKLDLKEIQTGLK